MYRTIFTLFTVCAWLGFASPGFAKTFEEVERYIEETSVPPPPLSADEIAVDICCGSNEETRMEEVRKVPVQSERDRVMARFVNPHPELGCMYYDVNNVRRWQPGCHDS